LRPGYLIVVAEEVPVVIVGLGCPGWKSHL